MPPKKTKEATAPAAEINVNDQLDEELKARKLSIVRLAQDCSDMSVDCISTGYPQLDFILHPEKRGMPRGRDVELFSTQPEVGKTSIALEILRSWQEQGYRTAIIDVERTITHEYLDQLDIQTDPKANPRRYAVRIVRSEKEAIPAEEILDTVRDLGKMMDLIVVDSIAALEKKANLDKDTEAGTQVGGISKMLAEHTRKNVSKRATILWINQTRMKVGGFSPSGDVTYVTVGGKALPFFASIRLDMSVIEKIKDSDEVVGYKVQVYTKKNKIAPQDRKCILSYLHGEGFSVHYDYFEAAKKMGIITKNKAWLYFGDDLKVQGDMNFVHKLKEDRKLFEAIKSAVDGEDVTEDAAPESAAAVA